MNLQQLEKQALHLDQEDQLKHFRVRFHLPRVNDKTALYFCGNSLGLQPKDVAGAVEHELKVWQNMAVEGHFKSEHPWVTYHKLLQPALAHITGAREEEVVAMNNLTSNLHFMMVSFYRPQGKRFKILMEAEAFPSDMYAVETQVKYHGYSPHDAIIEVAPEAGNPCITNEQIIRAIQQHGDEIALVLMPGVQYYTGQVLDVEAITRAGQAVGAKVGFDLAHAVGNVPLALHDWNVDFAVWCTYKYLNSGPGNSAGVFVHERYAHDASLPRFAGWWGHREDERFEMKKGFQPMPGAAGWQLANANIIPLAAQRVAISITHEAGMPALREKSKKLTGLLYNTIRAVDEQNQITIITPDDPEQRGCQLSLLVPHQGKAVFDFIMQEGVICDWREPDVIRLAPTPLYNTFQEVTRFGNILQEALQATAATTA